MELRVLGTLEAVGDSGPIDLPRRQVRALLARLAVDVGHVVSSDRLVEDLWDGDPPAQATAQLHTLVSRLRSALGGDLVRSQPPGYVLTAEREQLDAMCFEREVGAGVALLRAGDARHAVETLEGALRRWRGPAFAEFADAMWARPAAARLDELRRSAIESLVDARLAGGDHAAVAAELERLIGEDPLNERLRARLVLALYRSGRQAEALRAATAAREMLREELGLDPGEELRELESAVLRQDPALRPAPERVRLPAERSSFHGRAEELQRFARLRVSHRLVTVVGPGGAGKTRLVVHALASMDAVADVCFVDLAPVEATDSVLPTVAAALGIADDGAARNPFEAWFALPTLLVLDNCEHVLPAVRQLVERLLAGSPEVTVVATSREPLDVAGEGLLRIGALDGGAATELFVHRAGAAGATIGDDDAEAVGDVCAALDDLPLAIELAASRLDAVPLRELAPELERSNRALARASGSARHDSVDATLDWSWRLLSPREQRCLAALTAFSGPFTREDVHAVASEGAETPGDVSTLLASLVGRSLVHPSSAGAYRVLDLVRRYGAVHLERLGRGQQVAKRHAAWLRAVADDVEHVTWDPEAAGVTRLVPLRDDLASALDRAGSDMSRDDALAIGLALVTVLLWSGQYREAVRRCEQVLRVAGDDPVGRVRTLSLRGLAALHLQDPVAAAHDLVAAADLATSLGHLDEQVVPMINLAKLLVDLGELPAASAALHRARFSAPLRPDVARGVDSRIALTHAYAALRDDPASARREVAQLLLMSTDLDVRMNATAVDGWAAAATGDLVEATHRFEEAVRVAQDIDMGGAQRIGRLELAVLAARRGELARARELATAVAADARRHGDPVALVRAHLLFAQAATDDTLGEADAAVTEALDVARARGDDALTAGAFTALADLERRRARPAVARLHERTAAAAAASAARRELEVAAAVRAVVAPFLGAELRLEDRSGSGRARRGRSA